MARKCQAHDPEVEGAASHRHCTENATKWGALGVGDAFSLSLWLCPMHWERFVRVSEQRIEASA